MKESTTFIMGTGDDAVEVNAWGQPVDEDVDFAEQHGGDNYDQMKVDGDDGLKAEVRRRREQGREIDTSGITKKSELIALLREDDAAQAAEAEDEDED